MFGKGTHPIQQYHGWMHCELLGELASWAADDAFSTSNYIRPYCLWYVTTSYYYDHVTTTKVVSYDHVTTTKVVSTTTLLPPKLSGTTMLLPWKSSDTTMLLWPCYYHKSRQLQPLDDCLSSVKEVTDDSDDPSDDNWGHVATEVTTLD